MNIYTIGVICDPRYQSSLQSQLKLREAYANDSIPYWWRDLDTNEGPFGLRFKFTTLLNEPMNGWLICYDNKDDESITMAEEYKEECAYYSSLVIEYSLYHDCPDTLYQTILRHLLHSDTLIVKMPSAPMRRVLKAKRINSTDTHKVMDLVRSRYPYRYNSYCYKDEEVDWHNLTTA